MTTTVMHIFFFLLIPPPPRSTLFPYTTLFRSLRPPISASATSCSRSTGDAGAGAVLSVIYPRQDRSEEHTSELQSRPHLVCRLLLEKKNKSSSHIYRVVAALERTLTVMLDVLN